uniref:Uncharacterized protein n=1 Tax=Noccaea caerulescens TaxID=107243 RepID=A0A1J3ECC9_NOCCA
MQYQYSRSHQTVNGTGTPTLSLRCNSTPLSGFWKKELTKDLSYSRWTYIYHSVKTRFYYNLQVHKSVICLLTLKCNSLTDDPHSKKIYQGPRSEEVSQEEREKHELNQKQREKEKPRSVLGLDGVVLLDFSSCVELDKTFEVIVGKSLDVLSSEFTKRRSLVEQMPEPIWVIRIRQDLGISSVFESISTNNRG